MVATAGWDGKVSVYVQDTDALGALGAPVATVTLPSNPETVLWLEDPDTGKPVLLLTRRDSTFLYYYDLPTDGELRSR